MEILHILIQIILKNKISKNHSKDWLGVTGEDNPSFGIKRDDEFREKLRQANLGKKMTEETKRKISKALTDNPKARISRMKQAKEVIMIDKNTGEKIKEYESISEASRNTNITRSNISEVCRGKRNTAGGYKWVYKNCFN